jgi:HSP90 family molecular chaperone
MANTKVPYKYKLHYSTDIPLEIRALLYAPSLIASTNPGGVHMEDAQVHLYSRKVLIKENCQELLPHYLCFMKGVVDCEDIPLNISRETYQDTNLIRKLSKVITRRVLKMFDEEARKDPKKYNQWYKLF